MSGGVAARVRKGRLVKAIRDAGTSPAAASSSAAPAVEEITTELEGLAVEEPAAAWPPSAAAGAAAEKAVEEIAKELAEHLVQDEVIRI